MDLIKKWNIEYADKHELHQILMTHFSGSKPTKDGMEFHRDGNVVLIMEYNKKGRLIKICPLSMDAKDSDIIRDKITENLHKSQGEHFYRRIAFFTQPVQGFYRFRNDFQLTPVPPVAPRPELLGGDHPSLFEMHFPGSLNHNIQDMRADRRCREIESTLSLFIPSFSHIQKNYGGRKAWAFGEIIDGNITSEPRQLGYHYPGLSSGAPEFSEIAYLNQMDFLDSNKLYSRPDGIRFDENVIIPTEIDHYFKKIENLNQKERVKFYLACYWFHTAGNISQISASSYFIALVSSIEALLPHQTTQMCQKCGKPSGAGPTALFKKFLDQYAPDNRPEILSARRALYAVRSRLAHGSGILISDQVSFIWDIFAFNENNQSYYLRQIVRMAIINWLDEKRL